MIGTWKEYLEDKKDIIQTSLSDKAKFLNPDESPPTAAGTGDKQGMYPSAAVRDDQFQHNRLVVPMLFSRRPTFSVLMSHVCLFLFPFFSALFLPTLCTLVQETTKTRLQPPPQGRHPLRHHRQHLHHRSTRPPLPQPRRKGGPGQRTTLQLQRTEHRPTPETRVSALAPSADSGCSFADGALVLSYFRLS